MSRPVLVRITNNLGLGGVQRRLATVLPLLAEHYDVHVVVYRALGELADELEAAGVVVHHVPLRGKWDLRGIGRMADLLREVRADVVHTHSLGGNVSGMLAAWRAGVPVRVAQVHLSQLHWYGRGLHRYKQIVEEALIHRLISQRVCFVSAESRDYFQRHTGLPDHKLTLLHNGFDFARLRDGDGAAIRKRLGVAPDERLIGFVGRLARGKGVEFFIERAMEAANDDQRLRFVLVGGGANPGDWQRCIEAAGYGERIVFVGPQTDMAAWWAALDGLFFTSEAGVEGMPGVVLEACACGLPVLARDTAPVREIADYYPRMLFLDETAPTAPQLHRALALPEVSEGNAARFEGEFSATAMAERTRALYEELQGRASV